MPILAWATLAGLAAWLAIKGLRGEPAPPAGYAWPAASAQPYDQQAAYAAASTSQSLTNMQLMLLRMGYLPSGSAQKPDSTVGPAYAIVQTSNRAELLNNPVFSAGITRFLQDYPGGQGPTDVAAVYNWLYGGAPEPTDVTGRTYDASRGTGINYEGVVKSAGQAFLPRGMTSQAARNQRLFGRGR